MKNTVIEIGTTFKVLYRECDEYTLVECVGFDEENTLVKMIYDSYVDMDVNEYNCFDNEKLTELIEQNRIVIVSHKCHREVIEAVEVDNIYTIADKVNTEDFKTDFYVGDYIKF